MIRPNGPAVPPLAATQPLPVSTARVVLVGVAVWLVALVVTLVVPALHTGGRSWWPATCISGAALGLLGHTYLRRTVGGAGEQE